jgi:ubiquinone biosynthesis protein
MVATDRSASASRAVDWAARMAESYGAELWLLQVLVPERGDGADAGAAAATQATFAAQELQVVAAEIAGGRGRARVVVDTDPARGIVEAAHQEKIDVLVVGNVGMSGRKEFLLGNVPNRVSHNARCTVVIVNTAQDGQVTTIATGASTGRPFLGDGKPFDIDVRGKLLGRATTIAKVMARHGVKELFASRRPAGEDTTTARARGFRSALEELGPTFAKLGQILSTRPDLLPPAFVQELAQLQDNVPPLTQEEVVRVMEEELGVPWEDVFETIEAKPMAAGTIAQVHRATLAGGERVVAKVQRPTAREDILQDLGLLEMFAEKTSNRPGFRQVVDMPAIFEHLSESLKRELDFTQEAANIERMADVLAPYDRLAVPRVHSDYTTSRLLVMEEIQGVPIRRAPHGEARKEAARELLESYYRQILTDGFFHADPHPGNLMWWQDRVYFLDFGMVGELGAEVRELLMLLLMAFWQEDVSFLTEVTLMLAGDDQRGDIDVAGFQDDIGKLMARHRNLSLQEIQLGPILQGMTEIAIRHDVRLPASLALTGKALAQMQLATAELDPDLDPFAIAGRFLTKGLMERFRERSDPKRLFYEAQKIRVRVVRLIEAFERLSGARPGPKLTVNFRGTERLEDTVRTAGRRVSLALTAGGALVAVGITASSKNVAKWIPRALGATGAALTAGLVGDLLRKRR